MHQPTAAVRRGLRSGTRHGDTTVTPIEREGDSGDGAGASVVAVPIEAPGGARSGSSRHLHLLRGGAVAAPPEPSGPLVVLHGAAGTGRRRAVGTPGDEASVGGSLRARWTGSLVVVASSLLLGGLGAETGGGRGIVMVALAVALGPLHRAASTRSNRAAGRDLTAVRPRSLPFTRRSHRAGGRRPLAHRRRRRSRTAPPRSCVPGRRAARAGGPGRHRSRRAASRPA